MLKEKLWKENGSEVQVRTVLRTMSKRTGVFERTGVGAKVIDKRGLTCSLERRGNPRTGGGSKDYHAFLGLFWKKLSRAQKLTHAIAERRWLRLCLRRSAAPGHRMQALCKCFRGRTALGRVLGQTGGNQLVKGCRNRRVRVRGWQRRGGKNPRANTLQGVGIERAVASNHFIHDHAEGENIRAG